MCCLSGKYWFAKLMQVFQMLTYFITIYQNIAFGNITTRRIRKSLFSIGKLSSSQWQILISPNSNFFWKACILSQGTSTFSCFLGETGSPFFKKMPANYLRLDNRILSAAVLSSTIGVLWKCRLGHQATQTIAEMFPLEQPTCFHPQQHTQLYVHFSWCHTGHQKYMLSRINT